VALCQPQIPRELACNCTWEQLTWHCPLLCENHTHPTNKLCGQDVELTNITTNDKYKYSWCHPGNCNQYWLCNL
jgi:hypothetical protein